jgi:hypothetical protein
MVLSGFSHPKKSKISEFVSCHPKEIEAIFLQVLSDRADQKAYESVNR